jgi:hypothetical protein
VTGKWETRSSRAKSRDVSRALRDVSRLRSTRTALGFALLVGLAACGKQQRLRPLVGEPLPVTPATSPAQPTPDQLLANSPTLRPGRSDELLTRSQQRPDDRFDLPPR